MKRLLLAVLLLTGCGRPTSAQTSPAADTAPIPAASATTSTQAPPELPAVIVSAADGITAASRVDPPEPPPTEPTIPPTPDGPSGSRCGEWWSEARDVGWPEEQLPMMDRVMFCESRCDPAAHNRSGASGLMQIMPFWWHGRDPYTPNVNLAMALEILGIQGWRAWSCS